MALSAVFKGPFQPVVSERLRQFISIQQQLHNSLEFFEILVLFLEPLDVSLELGVTPNGPHGSDTKVIIQCFS